MMRWVIMIMLALVGHTSLVAAQIQFASVVGGTDNDWGYSLIQTADMGFVMTGVTYSDIAVGSRSIMLSQFDPAGNHLWTKTVGGPSAEGGSCIVQAADGGFAIAGYSFGFGAGGMDIMLTRLDPLGNHIWTTTVGGTSFWDYTTAHRCLVATSDGGFAVAGIVESFGAGATDIILSRFDADGNHLWSTTVGGTDYDRGYSLVQTSDEGFALSGYTKSFGAGNWDVIVCRFDFLGNHLWTKTVGGTADDYGESFIQTSDGGFAIAGWTRSFGGGIDHEMLVLFRLDSSGNPLWTTTLSSATSGRYFGKSVAQTADGGFVVAGHGGGTLNFLLSRFDSSGNHLGTWFGGGPAADWSFDVIQTMDGGFAAGGMTESYGAGNKDFLLVKYDTAGATCMGGPISPSVNFPSAMSTSPNPTVTHPNPTITHPNLTVNSPTPADTVVCYYEPPAVVAEFISDQGFHIRAEGGTILFSLPTAGQARLSIYDPTGRLVSAPIDGFTEAGEHEIDLGLDRGVYFAALRYMGGIQTLKLVR